MEIGDYNARWMVVGVGVKVRENNLLLRFVKKD
jgi:hypothetical protein